MGGKSSKQKSIAASQNRGSTATVITINTQDGDIILSEGKKQKKKGIKKSKSKENVNETGNKKRKNSKKKHSGCQNHKRISFEEKTICGLGGGGIDSGQRSRKKSACPSCDARDMLLDQVRSRSGSLRYTDFNKVVRQSRIYDVEESPANIPLDGVDDPKPEAVCFVCGVYTGSVTRTCRVCCHVYHNGCLQKIGQAMDLHALKLAQLDMWSCHQCSDVSRLLTREETQRAFNSLESLDIDPDSVTVQNYIEYKEKMWDALGRTVTQETKRAWIVRFNFVACDGADRDDDGGKLLDWSQFLQAETISFIRNRCKESVVKLMTDMEFCEARQMYREMMDQDGNTVTMAQVKDRIVQLYYKFGIGIWPEDEEDVNNLDERDFDRHVSWDEFLRILSIHMITLRENNSSISSSDNDDDCNHGNYKDNGAMTPSFDSVDDEDYRTCESDLESPTATETKRKISTTVADGNTTLSRNKTGHKKNLSDVQILNESGDDANQSLSILEDLSRAFNLNGDSRPCKNQNNESNNQNDSNLNTGNIENSTSMEEDSSPATEFEPSTTAEESSSLKRHLWTKSPPFRDSPNFTTSVDIPSSRENLLKEASAHISLENSPVINKRRSEVLVRPSTEEGRSPRRALSQKLVAPAYGLVDKIQTQDWKC